MHLPTHKLQFRQRSATASPDAATSKASALIPTPATSDPPHPPPPTKSHSFNIKNKCNVQTGVSVLQNVSKWTDKAALTLQKHGNHTASKRTIEKHQVNITKSSGEKGEHTTEVSREGIVHQQTEIHEKPAIATGMDMHNTGVRRETFVYKEPESTGKSGTTEYVKVDKKAKPACVLSNAVEAGGIAKSEHYDMTAPTIQDDYQKPEIIRSIEKHDHHGHDGGDDKSKHTEHMEDDTDNEHEYPDTSDDESEHGNEYEHSGDEESFEDDDNSDEEDEEVETEQKTVTASSATRK